MTIDLILNNIEDPNIRENFFRILKLVQDATFLKGSYRHLELVFTKAVTNYKYSHGLGFIPKDVIQTFQSGAGVLTWNFDKFDSSFINVTTTGAVTVRAFVGAYKEDG